MPERLPLLVALFTSTLGLFLFWQSVLRRARARMTTAADEPTNAPAVPREELNLPFGQRVIQPLLSSVGEALARQMPHQAAQRVNERLRAAGGTMSYVQFIAAKVLMCATLAIALFAFVLPQRPVGDRGRMILPLGIACLFAFYLPDLLLTRGVNQRRQLYERQVPDALDLLCISVEAGLGFDAAIQRVAEKFADPMASELRAYLAETRLGRPRAEALRNLAQRSGLAEMRSFTGAVIQAEQLGVSLARTLRSQSDMMRVRRRQRLQEQAARVPVKMLFPMVVFILPCVFIVVLGPSIIQISSMFGTIIP